MTTYFLIAISIFIFLLGIIITTCFSVKKNKLPKTIIIYLMVVCALALLPLYLNGNLLSVAGPVDTIISSVLGVTRTITGENSVNDTRSMLDGITGNTLVFVYIYTGILHLVVVVLVFGVLLSFFQNFFPNFIYRCFARGKLFVFNEINQRSIILAKDIKNKDKKTVLVFLKDDNSDVKISADMLNVIQELRAFTFNISVTQIKICNKFFKKAVKLLLIKSDEEANLKDLLGLHEKYSTMKIPVQNKDKKFEYKPEFDIYILNSSQEAEALLDYVDYSKNFRIRLIPEIRLNLYKLFNEMPLYHGERNGELEILIIGAGKNGMEATKIASWCGQTFKLNPKIIVVDSDANKEKEFEMQCPELAEKTATENSKMNCNVKFYVSDVQNSDFIKIINNHPNVGYVICALGNEELNLRTAINVRKMYNELHYLNEHTKKFKNPIINVLLDDPFLFNISPKLKMYTNIECDLRPFGSIESLYTLDNISNSNFDKMGQKVNFYYELEFSDLEDKTDKEAVANVEKVANMNYENMEYRRSSSIAFAVHCKYKAYACFCEKNGMSVEVFEEIWKNDIGKMIDLLNENLNEEMIKELAMLEHLRWNYYQRSLGFKSVDINKMDLWVEESPKKEYRNFAAKLHPSIVDWKVLEKLTAHLKNKWGKIEEIQSLDKMIVSRLSEIISVLKNKE